MSPTDREEDIELGEEVQSRRSKGSALVAVRVPTILLRQIQAYAQERSLTLSDVLRLGAERLVQEAGATGISMTVRTTTWSTDREAWAQPGRDAVVFG